MTTNGESKIDPLAPTRFIDSDSAAIRAVAQRLISKADNERERAIAIFSFVRDQITFGFARGFWDNTASDVLRQGIGFCNTQSTLFVALLRAAGIPARQVFVEINSAILYGIVDTGTAMVDHSYVEVLLGNRWIATDAYILDPPLFRAAKPRLLKEDRLLGYGAHQTGVNDWDGKNSSFSQYNMLDSRPLGGKVWGPMTDVGEFYDRVPDAHNRLNPLVRSAFGLITARANRKAEAFRANQF